MGGGSVRAAGDGGPRATLAFSVTPPLTESQFSALEKRDLDALFGKAKYALADDPQSLERATQIERIGHEIFPWLMALILILVTAENFLANRFHREGAARPAVGVPT